MIDLFKDDEAFLFLATGRYPNIATLMDDSSSKKTVVAWLVETDDDNRFVIPYDGKVFYLLIATEMLNKIVCFIGSDRIIDIIDIDFKTNTFLINFLGGGSQKGSFKESVNIGYFSK